MHNPLQPPRRLVLALVISVAAGAAALWIARPQDSAPPDRALTDPAEHGGLAIEDDLGRVVRLTAPPRRVLSLSPATTELVFALGAADRLVGRTAACDHPAGAAAIPSVGTLFPPDLERLAAVSPDLALMSDGLLSVREALAARGVPVYVLQPESVDAALESFTRVGRLLDAEPGAAALVTALRAGLPPAPAVGTARPTVFYEVWSTPLTTAGEHTFLADVLRRAGARPILGEGSRGWPTVPVERLVEADPRFILTPLPETPRAVAAGHRPGWETLTAAREGRLRVVPEADALVRPGPRLAQAAQAVRALLHEETSPTTVRTP